MGAGMGESVADLAQHHQPEGRRQVEDARIALAYPAAAAPAAFWLRPYVQSLDKYSIRWTASAHALDERN